MTITKTFTTVRAARAFAATQRARGSEYVFQTGKLVIFLPVAIH